MGSDIIHLLAMEKTNQEDYYDQMRVNEYKFAELVKIIRPDIWSLMDAVDTTRVNYTILLKTIYHLDRIANGSKFGSVTIDIQNGTATFIRGEESDRLNQPIIVPTESEGLTSP